VNRDRWREQISVSRERIEHAHRTARELRQRATPSEQVLWAELRADRFRAYRFRRQHPIGPYIVDFFSSRAALIVEIDGPIHDSQVEYDVDRQAELEGVGYRVLRVTGEQVMRDLSTVLGLIEHAVRESPHPPTPSP
jgi:very-short-patch-repair endonuclease